MISQWPYVIVTYNVKWPFKPFEVFQGHVFWGQWKGDKGLNIAV